MEHTPSPAALKLLGVEESAAKNAKFVEARGCKFCNESGYKGRVGIFEVLKATPQIQRLITNRASADEIRKLAREQGMKTLREAAVEKVLSGVTTAEEVIRVTLEHQQ
jgi:type II secretory ATPase GspE/PulE/Tfp pilus assembly ATPase PilB-like protein